MVIPMPPVVAYRPPDPSSVTQTRKSHVGNQLSNYLTRNDYFINRIDLGAFPLQTRRRVIHAGTANTLS